MASVRKRLTIAGLAGVLAVPLLAQGSTASAGVRTGPALHWEQTLTKSLVGPLQLHVEGRTVYVTDSLQSILRKLGGPTLAHGPDPTKGGDVAGVAVNTDNGDIAYGSSNGSHSNTRLTLLRNGQPYRVTNLARYESNVNPDRHTVYGMLDPAANRCAANALAPVFHAPAAQYTGTVDSHPYAVAYLGGGAYAVADAGGNDIVRVGPNGHPTRIAVLPRQAFLISQTFADANSLPACAVGVTFYTEAVPTDVEKGPGGNLIVSTLSGGPEGGAGVPARGKIYKINPSTHTVTEIGSGFAQSTNVAVNSRGQIYVTELGAGRVSTLQNGSPKPVFHATAPVGIEAANGKIYLSTAPALVGKTWGGRVWVLAASAA